MDTRLSDASRSLRALIESVGQIVHQHAPLILLGFSALYVAGTAGRASQKLLWHDELFTLHVSRLPLSNLWAALATPSDQTPPLFHLVTRAFMWLLGDGLIAIRLPAILGFLLAMLCLYAFVARRYGPLYGLLAAVVPVATNAYYTRTKRGPTAWCWGSPESRWSPGSGLPKEAGASGGWSFCV